MAKRRQRNPVARNLRQHRGIVHKPGKGKRSYDRKRARSQWEDNMTGEMIGEIAKLCGRRYAEERIIDEARRELESARGKFPRWPDHIIDAAQIVGEEADELRKAAFQFAREPDKRVRLPDVRHEAMQTLAMALRFISILDRQGYSTGARGEVQDA